MWCLFNRKKQTSEIKSLQEPSFEQKREKSQAEWLAFRNNIRIIWEKGIHPFESRIAIVPRAMLDEYLSRTDAESAATFDIANIGEDVFKVRIIWCDGQ